MRMLTEKQLKELRRIGQPAKKHFNGGTRRPRKAPISEAPTMMTPYRRAGLYKSYETQMSSGIASILHPYAGLRLHSPHFHHGFSFPSTTNPAVHDAKHDAHHASRQELLLEGVSSGTSNTTRG